MNTTLTHNNEQQRFELALSDGSTAFITYRTNGDTLHLFHSEVPAHFRGRGIGKELVHKTLDRIEKERKKAVPHCPFIRAVAERSEKWNHILERG